MNYSFHSIHVNGREVEIRKILEEKIVPLSPFEASLFSFIQLWSGPADSFFQQTSGSTGAPKSIVITRQQMISSAFLTQQALGLNAGDTALLCLDPDFIAGKMMIVRSFTSNMKIVAVNPSTNPLGDSSLKTVKVDFTALVPYQLHEILGSEQKEALNEIRNILVGGAAVGDEMAKSLSSVTSNIYATYGMTETVSHVALQLLTGSGASEYFTTLPGIKIGIDTNGCLEIIAPFLNDKISTRDLVEVRNDQQFKWIGRVDNVVNSGGIKIIPETIESEIAKLFGQLKIANRFIVSSRPDTALGNKLILLIEGDLEMTIDRLKSRLKKELRPYAPKEVYINVNFVLTKTGKINRSETLRKIST